MSSLVTALTIAGGSMTYAALEGETAASPGSLPMAGAALPHGAGAPAEAPATGNASHWNVLNWAPGDRAAVVFSYGYNRVDANGERQKRIFVSTGANADVAAAATETNWSTSSDSGKKFLTTEENFPGAANNIGRLPNGSLINVQFIPQWIDQSAGVMRLLVQTSQDGSKWETKDGGVVTPPAGKKIAGLRVHRRTMVMPDGTLLVPAYGSFVGGRAESFILQSTDEGSTWTFRSTIPLGEQRGTNEVGWSRTSDGRLLAVMRTTDAPARLAYSYSADEAKTWTTAKPLLGPDGTQVTGIFPDLLLQPNGMLVLTTGRPDVRYLVSNDGTGRTWDTDKVVFANNPSTTNNGRYDGSSGNNSLENVGSSRNVLFFDQCHVWGCGAYNQQMGVSATYVSALTPGVGRIDVMSKLLSGTARVSGTFVKPDKRYPEMRPWGAFDGSSAVGAQAGLTGTAAAPGNLVLALDRAYDINKIGLMLGHGEAQSATVQLSTDGTTWSSPVITATDRKDTAMKYAEFDSKAAKFVKVTGAAVTVTEMELYAANVDTFENEIPFSVPRGWTGAKNAWVTDIPNHAAWTDFGGFDSDTALRLWDKWEDQIAEITRPTSAGQRLTASMQMGGADFRTHLTYAVQGKGSDGAVADVWKFRVDNTSTPTLQAWNGSGWVVVGALSAPLKAKVYQGLSLDVTPSSATIRIGSDSFTTTVRAGAADTVQNVRFTTGDPIEYGGAYQIDDFTVSTQ